MKPKLKTCLLVILLLGWMPAALAQTISRPDTYNYTMGVEALRNNNPEEALEYLNKELEDNPDNGYALAWIAFVRNYHGEYGRALTAADLAVRKIPENDKEYRAFAYVVRADAHVALGENEKALDDLTSAAVETPDDVEIYGKRADLYCYMGKYDLAEKDYRKVISIDTGNVLGYMGIGLIANVEKRYEDAIELFDYVTGLAPEYSSGYSFRAESYIGLRRYEEAVEDIARALAVGYDDKAFSLMLEVPDSAMSPLVEKLRMQSAENPGNGYWPYCLGAVYEAQGAYRTAIACYVDSQKKSPSSVTAYRISNCYSETGDFASALKHIDFAIALDSTDYGYVMAKADLQYESGDAEAAISELDRYVAHYPEFYGGYYRRGFYKDNSRDVDGAIEDYTMSITLEPMCAYAYLGRGDMYSLKGDSVAAAEDYRKVVELDTVPGSNSCAQYAWLELGQKDKAVEFMDKIIENAPDDAGIYYDAACLYSRMGDTEKSLEFLKTAFEKGYRRFAHIEMDDELGEIKQCPEYKELILKYRKVLESEIEEMKTRDGLSFITGRPSFAGAMLGNIPGGKIVRLVL